MFKNDLTGYNRLADICDMRWKYQILNFLNNI